jgi:hypothetical protein
MGLDKWNFLHMTPDEFFKGWRGYDQKKKENWDVAFWISKFNAVRTAFTKEQAKQAIQDKAPWRKDEPGQPSKPMSVKAIRSILNLISK